MKNSEKRNAENLASIHNLFTVDGTTLQPSDTIYKYIVQNDQISDFLNSRQHYPNALLIGPKGAGKSVLLRFRSWKYIDSENSYTLLGNDDYTINFKLNKDLDKEDLQKYLQRRDYITIWEFSLKYFILKNLMEFHKIELPHCGNDQKKLPGAEILNKLDTKNGFIISELGAIVSLLLKNRSVIAELDTDIIGLNEIFIRLFKLKIITKPISLYIDNIDQEFLKKLLPQLNENDEERKDDDNFNYSSWMNNREKNAIVSVWLNANIAFLEAVQMINHEFSNVSLFAAIRYEAWNHFNLLSQNANFPQKEANVILINYNDRELRKLIENFISIQNGRVKEILTALVSSNREHPIAKDKSINKEKFIDLIIRHTFRNPRDLIYLLTGLRDAIIQNEKENEEFNHNVDDYSYVIDELSHKKVFINISKECLPLFPLGSL